MYARPIRNLAPTKTLLLLAFGGPTQEVGSPNQVPIREPGPSQIKFAFTGRCRVEESGPGTVLLPLAGFEVVIIGRF